MDSFFTDTDGDIKIYIKWSFFWHSIGSSRRGWSLRWWLYTLLCQSTFHTAWKGRTILTVVQELDFIFSSSFVSLLSKYGLFFMLQVFLTYSCYLILYDLSLSFRCMFPSPATFHLLLSWPQDINWNIENMYYSFWTFIQFCSKFISILTSLLDIW